MANKISVLIDVTVDKGVTALKNFRTSVSEAQGVTNKFKAGFTSAADSVKQNAGAMAMAAGAALLTFGVKAVAAFTDAALAAENAGKAMGTSTEEASRWIAVGDDFGLTAEQVAAGLGKVTTTINDSKWDKYEIATRDASGAARDANEILLDTFDALSREANLTERSRMAKELLGKGYANLAPLIGKTRDELEGYLGSVESGQVITQEEADRARDMALAQDALSDALGEVTLAAGAVIAKFAPLIEKMAGAITTATELTGKLGVLGDVLEAEAKFLTGDFTGAISGATGKHVDFRLSAEELTASLVAQGFTQKEITELLARQAEQMEAAGVKADDLAGSTDDLAGSTDGLGVEVKATNREIDKGHDRLRDFDRAAVDANEATRDLVDTVARLRGELDQEQAALDFKAAIDAFGQAMVEAGNDTDAQSQAILTLKGDMLDYLGSLSNVPVSKQTEILALIDDNKLQEAERLLNALARTRTATVLAGVGQFSGSSGSGGSTGKAGKVGVAADGGVVTRATLAMIGEAGPEAVVPLSQMPGASPLGRMPGGASSGPVSIVVNVSNTDGQKLVNTLEAELRRRGLPTVFGR